MKRLLYKKLMLVLAITRSVVYKKRQPEAVDEDECLLLQLLDEEYTRHPFYGTRRMTQYLRGLGYVINRKRVQRLMRTLGLAGMAPRPNTSKQHPQHKLYPYLLRGVDVIAPNQVWSNDISYIRLRVVLDSFTGGADSTGHHHQHGRAGGVRWTISLLNDCGGQ
jgi:transposase InsO family protein